MWSSRASGLQCLLPVASLGTPPQGRRAGPCGRIQCHGGEGAAPSQDQRVPARGVSGVVWGGEPAVPVASRGWGRVWERRVGGRLWPSMSYGPRHLRRGCRPERGGHGCSRRGPECFPPLTFVGGGQGVARPAGSGQAALLGPPGVRPGGGGGLSGLEAGRHFPDSWLLSVVCPGPPAPPHLPSRCRKWCARGFRGGLGSGAGTPLGGWGLVGVQPASPGPGPPMTDTEAWG